MSDENKLLQMLTTQLHVMLVWTISRERFGRGYHELEDHEKEQVEGIVIGMIRHYWKHYDAGSLLGMVQSSSSDSVQ